MKMELQVACSQEESPAQIFDTYGPRIHFFWPNLSLLFAIRPVFLISNALLDTVVQAPLDIQ